MPRQSLFTAPSRRLSHRHALVIGGVLALASCGSSVPASEDAASAGPTSSGDTDATAVSSVPADAATGDAAIAAQAILVPGDLDGNWRDGGTRLLFPNSVELARPLGACEGLADIVFTGGSEHGVGQSRVLTKNMSPVFLYAVIFPTEEEAAAMMTAVGSPEFDECWAAFNEVAVPSMPLGFTGASYEPTPPPVIDADADAVNVEFLVGSVETGSGPFDDTCVCVFAQVGRGVVEVHSTEPTLTPEEREVIVQAAVDKLRSALDQS